MSNLPSGIDNYQPERRSQYLSRAAVTVELDLYSASQVVNYLNKYASRLDILIASTENATVRNDYVWERTRVRDHAVLIEDKIRRADD